MHARTMICRSAVIILIVALAGSAHGQSAPAVDPQSLLGEWEGTIKGVTSLDYYLILSKAEGATITGKGRKSRATSSSTGRPSIPSRSSSSSTAIP